MRRLVPVMIAIAVLISSASSQTEPALPRPQAPLALAQGEGVNLAFTLAAWPRPQRIQVLRAGDGAEGFEVVTELDAAELAWRDAEVNDGAEYLYAIRTRRGASLSELSPTTRVRVGGPSQITLLGGSTERALFRVTLSRAGRRLLAQFVHKPGESIGDLAWVDEINGVADFRLGPKLDSLSLAQGASSHSAREVLRGADGEPATDPAGRPIELDFRTHGATREILIAALTDGQGRRVELRDGESWQAD